MNKYIEMKKRHEVEINAFPMFFAFSTAQFEEGMKKLGVAIGDGAGKPVLARIGGGGFIRVADKKAYADLLKGQDDDMVDAIKADTKGTGFIYQMFIYELNNHEYCITQDLTDTLNTLGIEDKHFEKYPQLRKGLAKARMKAINCQEW